MKKPRILHALLAAGLLTSGLAAMTVAAPAAIPIRAVAQTAALAATDAPGITKATELNALFNNYGNGNGYSASCARWSGGDGTQSIPLPNNRRLWSFSDTYLGDPALRANGFHTSFINNSMIVQDGNSLRTITGGNTCREKEEGGDFYAHYAKAPVRDATGFYWTAAGTVVGSNVVKFYFRNEKTTKLWRETGSALTVQPTSAFGSAVVQQPAITQLPVRTPFGDKPLLWGLSLLEEKDAQGRDWVYIYGIAKKDLVRNLYVARVLKPSLASFGAWEFRTSAGTWSGAQADAAPIPNADFNPAPAFSVRKLNGKYWFLQREPGIAGGDIVAHPADTPWGFTQKAVTLYTPPEGSTASPKYLIHYDAQIHDGLGGAGQVMVSYNVNTLAVSIGCRSMNDHDASIYRPRFIKIPLAAFDATKTATISNTSGEMTTSPVVTSGPDNGWYNSWAVEYPKNCPPLEKSKSTTITAKADGAAVNLSWNAYGRDMWYWIERRDTTVNPTGPFEKVSEMWATGTTFTDYPITRPGLSGHNFEYRITPFASGRVESTDASPGTTSVKVALPAVSGLRWSQQACIGTGDPYCPGHGGYARLTWNAVPEATHYTLYERDLEGLEQRMKDGHPEWREIPTLGAMTATSYSAWIEPGETRDFMVVPGTGKLVGPDTGRVRVRLPENHYDPIVNWMTEEMVTNAFDPLIISMRALSWAGDEVARTAALLPFKKKVEEGGPWDHKPKIKSYWVDQESAYSDVPGTDRKVYHDVWSNIHYGYVGRAAEIPRWVLLEAQKRFGTSDASDDYNVKAGMDLWEAERAGLKPFDLDMAVRAGMARYTALTKCLHVRPRDYYGPDNVATCAVVPLSRGGA
jgi:Bacterial toxin 44